MINKHGTTGLIISLVFLFIGCSTRYLKNPNDKITFTYDEGDICLKYNDIQLLIENAMQIQVSINSSGRLIWAASN